MCRNNFILLTASFEKGINDKETIYKNIERLNDVNGKIKSFDDSIYKEDAIFSVNFIDNKQLYEILFSEHIDFKQDYKTMLIEIINKAKTLNDENCHYIGLNHVDTPDNIIYTISNLMQSYYDAIENISSEEEFFICVKKYFQNLVFHDNVKTSLPTLKGAGLKCFSKDIISTLKTLENNFQDILQKNHQDVRKSLLELSTIIGLETTIEGNIDRKPDFTFNFKQHNGSDISICCEPHVKLCRSSIEGDSTYYFNRLHFHVGNPNVGNGKILIGSIGYHL